MTWLMDLCKYFVVLTAGSKEWAEEWINKESDGWNQSSTLWNREGRMGANFPRVLRIEELNCVEVIIIYSLFILYINIYHSILVSLNFFVFNKFAFNLMMCNLTVVRHYYYYLGPIYMYFASLKDWCIMHALWFSICCVCRRLRNQYIIK